MIPLRRVFLTAAFTLWPLTFIFANGGAWQTGISSTGNATASDKKRSTEVTIEEENLTIDLHQEFAAVEVHYRMRNTDAKVLQDFFFPVERWAEEEGGQDGDGRSDKPADLENYQVMADATDLKWKNIDLPVAKKPEPTPEPETTAPADDAQSEEQTADEQSTGWTDADTARVMEDFSPTTRHWKKSEIPFAPNQTREIVIRYHVRYGGFERSVSDDSHASNQVLAYSLSPAATWKGVIGHGKITVNVLHPVPEEVAIERPKDRFQKIGDTRYEWDFRELEPTLDDDLKIVAHRAYHSYSASNAGFEGEQPPVRDYIIQGDRYFLLHAEFDAVASSTLPPSGDRNYEVKNIKTYASDFPWCEGAEGDGVGESITVNVARPLPLDSITIMPGYHSMEKPTLWEKNNRVAELEVTLNGEKTFTVKIPDEHVENPYPIPVRDYAEPVKTVKLVIKGVHRGTAARDTCISDVRLKGKLAQKPKFQPAR